MTPERLAKIEAYVKLIDLDQLPGWTMQERIIADLWEALGQLRDEISDRANVEADLRAQLAEAKRCPFVSPSADDGYCKCILPAGHTENGGRHKCMHGWLS